MGTWNALYFRGELPIGFRPDVEGTCSIRTVADWTELSLPGVVDGEASALALSKLVEGQVVWAVVQTTASVVGVAHYHGGTRRRLIEFGDGSWVRVEGEPQPWEASLFSAEELDAAKEISDPDNDAELEEAFAGKTLGVGRTFPWPREWETLRYAIGVSEPEWNAAHASLPVAHVQGRGTSKLTHVARIALFVSVGCFAGLWFTSDPGFGGFAVVSVLVMVGAGFLRRATLGRWFL